MADDNAKMDELIAEWDGMKAIAEQNRDEEIRDTRKFYDEDIRRLRKEISRLTEAKAQAISEVKVKWDAKMDQMQEAFEEEHGNMMEMIDKLRAKKASMAELAALSYTSTHAADEYRRRLSEMDFPDADAYLVELYRLNRRAIAERWLWKHMKRKFGGKRYWNERAVKYMVTLRIGWRDYETYVKKYALPPLPGKNPRRAIGLRGTVESYPSEEHMDRHFPIMGIADAGQMLTISQYDLPDSFTRELW